MDLTQIQQAIEALSPEQEAELLSWLIERENAGWDAQLERDFSPGGAGMSLLNKVKARVRSTNPY